MTDFLHNLYVRWGVTISIGSILSFDHHTLQIAHLWIQIALGLVGLVIGIPTAFVTVCRGYEHIKKIILNLKS